MLVASKLCAGELAGCSTVAAKSLSLGSPLILNQVGQQLEPPAHPAQPIPAQHGYRANGCSDARCHDRPENLRQARKLHLQGKASTSAGQRAHRDTDCRPEEKGNDNVKQELTRPHALMYRHQWRLRALWRKNCIGAAFGPERCQPRASIFGAPVLVRSLRTLRSLLLYLLLF